MAPPLIAIVGACMGLLTTGAAVLGGAVSTLSVGPEPPTNMTTTPSAIVAAAQLAAAACPGLDWTLVAGGALIDPSLAAGLASAVTELCALPPSERPAGLDALLPGPSEEQEALILAHALSEDADLATGATDAIAFAAANLGAPYRWGGTGPGGFDCSGLSQAAYAAAHIAIPRVAQDQFDAGPVVAPTSPLTPGDLVFFGSGPHGITHVGLYIGGGEMIDAPHTGAFVRIEPTPTTPGQAFGDDLYIGATDPGGQ